MFFLSSRPLLELLYGKTKECPIVCISFINIERKFDQIALPADPRMGCYSATACIA